jgi:hypothetical protein
MKMAPNSNLCEIIKIYCSFCSSLAHVKVRTRGRADDKHLGCYSVELTIIAFCMDLNLIQMDLNFFLMDLNLYEY